MSLTLLVLASLVSLFVLAALVTGCSDDDERPIQPDNPGLDAPPLPTPTVELHVHIHSADPDAQAAHDLIDATMADIDARLVDPLADYAIPLSAAQWQPAGGCSHWSFDPGIGCPWDYTVCRASSGFGWEIETDPGCTGPARGGLARHGFVIVDGSTTAGGSSGELRLHDHDTETVALAWRWSALDGRYGSWAFFQDAPPDSQVATLTWKHVTSPDADVLTLEEPGVQRIEFEGSFTEAAGEIRFLGWNGAAFVIAEGVTWDSTGEHGQWTSYDAEGLPETLREW